MSYTTPVELLNAICGAVREKDGTTESIKYQDLPQRVLDIPSGGGANPYYGTCRSFAKLNEHIIISGGERSVS